MNAKIAVAALAILPIGTLLAQNTEGCCEIVAIDAQQGTVRLEIGDSDKNFTLQIGSGDMLGSLQIGQFLGFEGQDDWESLEEGESLIPTAGEGWDPNNLEICCQVVDVDFGSGPAILAAQRLADGVTFEVLEMRRVNKNVLHFGFTIDNQTDEAIDPMRYGILRWVGSGPTKSANGIELHDLESLKYYRASKASSAVDLSVPPDGRREYWAQYKSPPDGVSALTVIISDTPPLYDVPIQ